MVSNCTGPRLERDTRYARQTVHKFVFYWATIEHELFESGDSSAAKRWAVDQEVVGSNPTHGGNLISVVRCLSGFTQPIR